MGRFDNFECLAFAILKAVSLLIVLNVPVHIYKCIFTLIALLFGHQTLFSMNSKYNIISPLLSNYEVQQKRITLVILLRIYNFRKP